MASILLLAIFGVNQALSQVVHNAGSFGYQGCATVDLSCFGKPLVFSDGRLTPETCQLACQKHQFAALFPYSCRCSDDRNAVRPEDEGKCDYPCMGDQNLGMCGSIHSTNALGIANVYTKIIPSNQDPGNGGQASSQNPTSAENTPCSSTVVTPDSSPLSSPQISSGGQPPGLSTLESSPTDVPAPQYTATTPPLASTCSTGDIATPVTPAPLSQGSQDPLGSAPEPKTVSPQTQTSPNLTITPSPPGYSSACQSLSPAAYSEGSGQAGNPGKDSLAGVDCSASSDPDLSPVPVGSTPRPGPNGYRPDGNSPVPSQVPGSDSTHGIGSPISSIGGLVLLAAFFI